MRKGTVILLPCSKENWDKLIYKAKQILAEGECDCDYCYIDYPSLIKNKGLNGFKKSSTSTVGAVSSAPKKDTNYNIYTVIKGDTLWGISQKFLKNGSRYPEIKKLNGLTSDTIYPGDKLKIPKY